MHTGSGGANAWPGLTPALPASARPWIEKAGSVVGGQGRAGYPAMRHTCTVFMMTLRRAMCQLPWASPEVSVLIRLRVDALVGVIAREAGGVVVEDAHGVCHGCSAAGGRWGRWGRWGDAASATGGAQCTTALPERASVQGEREPRGLVHQTMATHWPCPSGN